MGVFDLFRRKNRDNTSFNSSSANELEPLLPKQDLQSEFPLFDKDLIRSEVNSLSSRDMDLILSKLELINRKLDDIDKRVQFIEKIAKESQ